MQAHEIRRRGRLPTFRQLWTLARLRRDESGVAAVEFAIIAPVFFFLMFVIAETAMIFIAEQVMDNAVFESARLIRTGQVQGGWTEAQFTTDVCGRMSVFVDCTSAGDFFLEVKSYDSFAELDVGEPTDDDDNFDDPPAFDFGEPSSIIVVRAYYKWPTTTFFGIFGALSLANTADNKRLIGSFAAFRNEPFTEE